MPTSPENGMYGTNSAAPSGGTKHNGMVSGKGMYVTNLR